MVGATIPCRVPVVVEGFKNVSQIDTCVNTLDDLDPFNGPVGTAMVLGYLSNIWERVCAPRDSGRGQAGDELQGQGSVDLNGFPGGGQIAFATILCTTIPNDIDMVFGKEPLAYLGTCGFGSTGTTIPKFGGFGGTLFGDFGVTEVAYGRMEFINHKYTIWHPANPGLNTFWWNLKPGVKATIQVTAQSPGNGASCQYGLWRHWNPMAGGWSGPDEDTAILSRQEGLLDGCGYNVSIPEGGEGGGGDFGTIG